MLWCSVYVYYTALLNRARTQVVCIVDLYKFLIRFKAFNLFTLLENETLKMFSIRERCKNRQIFGGTKVCKADEVRKYFANTKIVIEVFSYIIFSLDFKKFSCTLLLLHMKAINGAASCYILALQHLFHFIACVSFLSIFFLFFFSFFCEFCFLLRCLGKFGDT